MYVFCDKDLKSLTHLFLCTLLVTFCSVLFLFKKKRFCLCFILCVINGIHFIECRVCCWHSLALTYGTVCLILHGDSSKVILTEGQYLVKLFFGSPASSLWTISQGSNVWPRPPRAEGIIAGNVRVRDSTVPSQSRVSEHPIQWASWFFQVPIEGSMQVQWHRCGRWTWPASPVLSTASHTHRRCHFLFTVRWCIEPWVPGKSSQGTCLENLLPSGQSRCTWWIYLHPCCRPQGMNSRDQMEKWGLERKMDKIPGALNSMRPLW